MSFRPFALLAPIALAALLLAPADARAQFTSFVAHPPRAVDSARTPVVALTDSARRARADSTRRAELTNMKTWVDSAALAAGTRVPIPVDTTAPLSRTNPVSPTNPISPTTAADTSVGMRAPDTATPLPTLLLGGFGALAAGIALLRRPR